MLSPDTIAIDAADPFDADAQHCLAAYYAELDQRFRDGFAVERSRDPDVDLIRPPHGAFLVARRNGEAIGCVALKGGAGAIGEVKRLWVAASARGCGLARSLMSAVEAAARERAMGTLRLDSNRALPEAIAMYRRWGWREIARFNDDPYADVFFEKTLS